MSRASGSCSNGGRQKSGRRTFELSIGRFIAQWTRRSVVEFGKGDVHGRPRSNFALAPFQRARSSPNPTLDARTPCRFKGTSHASTEMEMPLRPWKGTSYFCVTDKSRLVVPLTLSTFNGLPTGPVDATASSTFTNQCSPAVRRLSNVAREPSTLTSF